MSSPQITATFAALLIATAPVAYGETTAQNRAAAPTAADTQIRPDQIRASKMIGSTVLMCKTASSAMLRIWSSTETARWPRSW